MGKLESSTLQQPNRFTHRSETESICNFCLLALRADRYMSIEVAGEIHADLCLLRSDSPVDYVLW